MFYFALPAGCSSTLAGLRVRLESAVSSLPGLVITLDPNAREQSDRRSAGAVRVGGPSYSLKVVERARRGTGGENARFLVACGRRGVAAAAYPRRWELYETDPSDAYGNVCAWALDCIRDESPHCIAFDPRTNVILV